jgi:uncharacterized protein
MKRFVVGSLVSLVVGALIFLGYGGWHTASTLEGVLRVGGTTAQGDGWPQPQTPFDIGFTGDPASALDFSYRDVEIDGELGPLPAWLVSPQSGSIEGKSWGIIVHGIGGRRENGYRFLPHFRAAGMPTLMLAYRNDEGAPRDPSGFYAFGLTEWRDLEDAARYALDNGAASLVLLGESMGGGIVGQFLRRSELAVHVSGLIFDAPAFDFPSVLVNQMEQAGAPLPQVLAPVGMRLFALKNGLDIADADVANTISAFEGPVFISHGAADRIVPIALSDAVVSRRAGLTEYLRTDADHILSWKAATAEYDATLGAFLSQLANDR